MNTEDLSYSGPEKDYKPQPGSNPETIKSSNVYGSDSKLLLENLKLDTSFIIDRCKFILGKCENELSVFSIDLGVDEKRKQAANATWSDFSSSPIDTVAYKQIVNLEKRNDRASKFLLSEFKKELRKPSGSSAQDIKEMTQIVYDETSRIDTLINASHLGTSSSAEQTLVQILLDFTASIKMHVYRLDSFFVVPKDQRNRILPKKEIDPLTEKEATQYQSVFLLNVNSLNDQIDKDIDYMNKFFVNSSDFFYQKIITPLSKLEKEIPNLKTVNQDGSRLNDWTLNVKASIDRNYSTALYDIVDRIDKFNKYLLKFEEKIGLRENYLSYIRQLAQKGKEAKSTLVEGVKDSSFILREKSQGFINDHNSLGDREDGKAHEQYLMKYNDYLRGNLSFADFSEVDGIDLSHHIHNGTDGSALIDGKNIQDGSITTSLIEQEYNDKPKGLSLIGISGSETEVSAKFFWLTQNKNTINEIQVSKLQSIAFIDPGQEEPEIPEIPRVPGYIPPFESYDPLYIEWITEIDYELFFN
jgi:hypothetical protein